ncbi:MAG: hypothetical protein IJK04_14645, partial [Kiritimatiellae bacterium]|nr:hypothetical protein [Kiritimatiellia bacterium]
LLADGRIEAAYVGGSSECGPAEFRHAVRSRLSLEKGREVLIEVVNDGRSLRLLMDGELQGEISLPPLRAYGNLSPGLGGGVNGGNPETGILSDLEMSGCP